MVSLILTYKYTFASDAYRIRYNCGIISAPTLIDRTGCYELTKDVIVYDPNAEGIHIRAARVKLNLNGFSVKGPGESSLQAGIYVEGGKSVEIRNGRVEGFNIGIRGEDDRDGSVTESLLIEDIVVEDVVYFGLKLDAQDIEIKNAELFPNDHRSGGAPALVTSADTCSVTTTDLQRTPSVNTLEIYKVLSPSCTFTDTRVMLASEAD